MNQGSVEKADERAAEAATQLNDRPAHSWQRCTDGCDVLNQSLGLLLPHLPIEIHRIELRIAAKLHSKNRKSLQWQKGVHESASIREPSQKRSEVVDKGRIITEAQQPGLESLLDCLLNLEAPVGFICGRLQGWPCNTRPSR